MGIKNAGKAKISKNPGKAPTKETVDTPISECEAENPLNCRFHGLQALEQQLSALLPAMGYKVPFGTDKLQGGKGFEIRIDGKFDVNQGEFKQSLTNAFKQQGWDLTYNGKVEGAGHSFFLKRGKGEVDAETPSSSDKADIVDSSKPPKDDDVSEGDYGEEIFDTVLAEEALEELNAKGKENDSTEYIGEPDKLKQEDLSDFEVLLEEDMGYFDELLAEEAEGADDKEATSKQSQIGNIVDVDAMKSIVDDALDFLPGYTYVSSEKTDEGTVKLTLEQKPDDDESLSHSQIKEKLDELLAPQGYKTSSISVGKNGKDVLFVSPISSTEKTKESVKNAENNSGSKSLLGISEAWSETMHEVSSITSVKGGVINFAAAMWKNKNQETIDKLNKDFKEAESAKDVQKMGEALKELQQLLSTKPKKAVKESATPNKEKEVKLGSDSKDWNAIAKLVQGALDGLPGYTLAEVVGSDNGKIEVVMYPKPDDDESLTHEQIVSKITPFLKTLGVTVGPSHKKNGNVVFGIQELDGGAVSSPESKLSNQEPVSKQEQTTPSEESPKIMGGLDEALMKPLVHNDDAFPSHLSQKMLEDAIYNGLSAGGHGGLQTTIIEIDGKKFVCKKGVGKKSNIIKNGFNADMAYRAGGVYAPDAKLYEYGDGVTYKLSEFIEGERLIDIWKTADEAKRESIRKELLKGYPLDALFSNYDVLGTSPEESQTVTITGVDGKPQKTHVAFDNIIIGKDGHAYRIDNDGAFAMTGTGGHKSSSSGAYTVPVEAEHWDNWDERQWIDDFRTMRRNEKNLGMFDRYTTADIFLAAGNINLDNAVSNLPEKLQKALAKPLFEMKQMALYAHGSEVAGYKNQRGMSWKGSDGKGFTIECDPISMALDAIYNGHKAGIRKFLQKKISWMDTGWLSGSSGSSQAYVPKSFQKPEPQEPKPPTMGLDIAKEVLEGVKTIAYHVKTGDFNPNENRIKKALATKPFVEVLAKTGDPKAKGILEAIGKIEESIETGHKKALHFDTPDGFFDVEGLSLVVDAENSSIYSKHIAPIHQKWEKEHKKWLAEKKEWDEREIEKAKKAGAAPSENFQDYEDMLVTANINTDGIHQGGGKPSVNHDSKSAQKGTSFSKKSCLKKVRQYAMMGLSLDEMDFSNGDKTFYNGNIENGGHHVSGDDGVENYKWAVQYYRDNPEEFKKDMQAYAVHKGMLVLCHANMDNPAIDHSLLTCFVMRGEHKQAWGKDGKGAPTKEGIIKPYPIDSSTSACINETGHFGTKKIGWKLPIWRITDNFMIGAGIEEEICINPIKIPYPPMYFTDTSDGWLACMEKYNQQEEVKAIDKKLGKAEDK